MTARSRAIYVHPIRTLPIISYTGDDDCLAFIGDGKKYSFPYFRGSSRDEAEAAAEEFRRVVIQEYEEDYIKKMINKDKARERQLKKATTNTVAISE